MKLVDIKKVAILGTIVSSSLLLAACSHNKSSTTSAPATIVEDQSQSNLESEAVGELLTIILSETGFSPSPLNAKVGQEIVFKNTSSKVAEVNSVPHPTHELFPELNLGEVAPGASETVVFTKVGTYKYHNHLNASQNGQIAVE